MSMSNKHVFLRMINFTDNANKGLNKAISVAETENCGEINEVHIFVSMLDKCDIGKKIIEHLDTTYDMVYSSYLTIAHNGAYGKVSEDIRDSLDYPLCLFSQSLTDTFSDIIQDSIVNCTSITPDVIMDKIIIDNSDALVEFLDYIGLDIDEVLTLRGGLVNIPGDLAQFVTDLNVKFEYSSDTITPMTEYTNEMIEILSRKLKSNPCLIGHPGVGKTTVVNSLVQRILSQDVPDSLKNTHVIYINSALLTAGTKYRGEFEQRMQLLLDWASEEDVILFLDELHTFIDLGKGNDGASTAGNMIKKHLSDGTIKIIGTTTYKDYHKFIETDSAFNRRIEVVDIKEPSEEKAIHIIKNSIDSYVQFHNVLISDEIIETSVKLSSRYMKDKYLPDKAFTIIDQAAAKVKLAHKKEVTEKDVLGVVSKATGVKVTKLNKNEAKQLINLEQSVGKKLIGQESAVKIVCKAIRRAKAGVRESNKPLGSFLFVGPTGVGKTELCKVLTQELELPKDAFIRVDMSEFGEKHTVSKMIGSPPGYVGYGEGGQLTEKVKHNPYSLVLFDEIEKAHPDVFNTFLQLLDEGRLTDGHGDTVDFTNCIIVMTSNAGYGADGLNKTGIGFGTSGIIKSDNEKEKIAMKALESTFRPEFLNRLDNVVIFDKLDKEQCKKITKLLLSKLSDRLKEQNIEIKFNSSIIDRITANGYSDKYGARNLRREIQDTVEDIISDAILSEELKPGMKASVSWVKDKVKIKIV